MNLPKKEKIISLLLNIGLIVAATFLGYKLLENQTVMLIDNEAKEVVEFCESNVNVCQLTKTINEDAIK